ncbi:hypothetical protein [Thermoflexibacter ruber]|uniref:Uncharacterized protein n=1 Tax=Thermoflexibacter ruber TaxID=1003 RepID=A0A1I2ID67_9BACT|nr:hypothetical protein [Thermoflexibacter ruber]SFF38796.1 hypothetical protein SAMN04488541_10306 [Thermoflexibacter ruber]
MILKEVAIFPYYKQTFVSSYTQEQILERLREFTKEEGKESNPVRREFNGKIDTDGFQISRMITQANTFLPVIKGKIEGTKTGSILFITCEMFYTTKILLFIWTVIPLLIFLLTLLFVQGYFYPLLALFFGLFNYIVSVANFHRQRKISMQILDKILS